jgi:hypothetical protein
VPCPSTRPTRGVHRWAYLLMAYRYEIHDIAGDENVLADLLSRWGLSFKTVSAISQLRMPLSPQLDSAFVWPTMAEIVIARQDCCSPVTQSGVTLTGVFGSLSMQPASNCVSVM